MLYLHVFGDNVEDAMGHGRYSRLLLLCGVLAGLSHVATTLVVTSGQLLPSLGASGAISGVLSGYVVLFPRRRVRVLWFYSVVEVPAILSIGIWFAFQLFSGIGMLGGGIGRRRLRGAHRRISRGTDPRPGLHAAPRGVGRA